VSASFGPAGSLVEARQTHTATPLPDGRVLVVGGHDTDPVFALASAGVWDPATASFVPAASLREARGFHTATLLPDDRVLVVGGIDGFVKSGVCLATGEVWDPETASFGPAGSLVDGRGVHTATTLPDGRVLIVGGLGAEGVVTSAEVWDPEPPTAD
jgi:hypothetical protein